MEKLMEYEILAKSRGISSGLLLVILTMNFTKSVPFCSLA